MLTVKHTHKQYQEFVQVYLEHFYINSFQHITLLENRQLISKLWSFDLTGIVSILKNSYTSSNKGAPPKDAVALFRSLILMTHIGETSIHEWVKTLKTNPLYAILSGFYPACYSLTEAEGCFADSLPGVGTFYDFQNRLLNEDRKYKKSRLRKIKRKPRKKQKKNQKMDEPKTTITERLVKRVLHYNGNRLLETLESKLNQALKDLFVVPATRLGLLGDPNNLNIAGDGTLIATHASHYGKKVCSCKEKCNCKRLFTDPCASWGWDSFRECYVYGHGFHCFTSSDSPFDLPLHIKTVSAKRHDSITGIYALKELRDLYTEFKFNTAAFDSAYDFYSFYVQCNHYSIIPIIDLNSRNSKPDSGNEFIKLNDNGIPYCKTCNHKLRNWGIIRKSNRRKWLFPVQCDTCAKCDSTSKKSYYQPLSDNLRYFSPILRGSKQWKIHYRQRPKTERVWDKVKNDFHGSSAKVYTKELRTIRVFLGCFCAYIDAMAKASPADIYDILPMLLKKTA